MEKVNFANFADDIKKGVDVFREQYGDSWRVPQALLSRTMEYYARQVQQIREHLNKAGTDAETINVFLEDYARALFGVFDFRATREQMERILTLRGPGLFFIDKYGLYCTVLHIYSEILAGVEALDRLTAPPEQYKGTAPQLDAQQAYINGPNTPGEAVTNLYLIRRAKVNEFRLLHFSPAVIINGPADINKYLDRCGLYANTYYYALYYTICKFCINATREELEQITTPTGIENARQIAEQWDKMITGEVERLQAGFVIAEKQARKQKTGGVVRVSDTIAALLSRDVYGSKTGGNVRNENDILPIQLFINDYTNRHPEIIGKTTPRIIEKTIEGVNMLQRTGNIKPVGGWYRYETSITEFATLCGYDTQNPNREEIRGVFLSLMILNGLYLAVWRPRGLAAVKILNVREIGLTGEERGKLIIEVSTDATQGRPQLLDYTDFEKLRQAAKGYAENHFRYQIIGKGHKTENALLDEIFGYSNAIREATETGADAATLDGMKRNQQKNKPRDRKRLLKMFEQVQAAGFLTFRRYTNPKGETVYSWKQTAKPQEHDEPDTQEQPEQ